MYRSTSKGEQVKVNKDYREDQNDKEERSQQKERENTNTNEDNITSFTKWEIQSLKKDM